MAEFDAVQRLTRPTRSTSLVDQALSHTSTLEGEILNSDPPISAGMLRIETSINAAIQQLCIQHKISRDTYVEATLTVLMEHPSILKEVIEAAQKRYNKRKARGNAKRAVSMGKYKDFSEE